MAIKPEVIFGYAQDIQRLDFAPERARKVADELERLVDGIFAIAGAVAFGDDPDDFLATLAELRDTPDAGDE